MAKPLQELSTEELLKEITQHLCFSDSIPLKAQWAEMRRRLEQAETWKVQAEEWEAEVERRIELEKQVEQKSEDTRMLDWLADNWAPETDPPNAIMKAIYCGDRETLRDAIRDAMRKEE